MKTLLGTFELLNRLTGRYEPAALFEGIDESNLLSYERDWKIVFDARLPAAPSLIDAIAANAEDAKWDWRRLAEVANNPLLFQMYAVECANRMQGIMLVRKGGYFSRHPDHPKVDLVYIERIATAPWNRPRFMDQPVYKGVGQLLFAAAVNLSMDEDLGGRIGLHALSGAEPFYRDVLQMTDFGPDDKHYGLRYFEMSSAQAHSFLKPQEGEGA